MPSSAPDRCQPETPLPLLIPGNGLDQLLFPEIGPQDIREVELRVGHLPQEEIAQAILPARPDEQIRVRDASCGEIAREALQCDVRCADLSLAGLVDQLSHRPQDLVMASVVQGQDQRHGRVARRLFDRVPQDCAHLFRKRLRVTDRQQADIVLQHDLDFGPEVPLQEGHEGPDLSLRPAPVFR